MKDLLRRAFPSEFLAEVGEGGLAGVSGSLYDMRYAVANSMI
jgi:hypothetical protein